MGWVLWKKTLFIYKGKRYIIKKNTIRDCFQLFADFFNAFLGFFTTFYNATRQNWTKTISWQNLETKFLKDKFFCRQEGRSGTRQRQTEFNQGQGQLYNQGFQSQKSVAEKQGEAAQQHQPWRWQGREAGSRRTRSWRRTQRWGRWSLTTRR